jgi:superfamily II DNA or RNA helicase
MLRPYQTKAIDLMRTSIAEGKKRLILCSPTGSGKTVMFTFMVARALEKGKQAIIFTDRVELLKQSNGALDLFGIRPTLIESNKTRLDVSGNCFIAMAQTFSRRKDATEYTDLLNRMDLVIIDEAHKQTFNPLLTYINPNAVVIGATATPLRRGNQECLSKFYEVLHVPVQVQELIQQGYLASPVTYGVNQDLSGIRMKGNDYDTEQMALRFSERKVFDGVVQNYTKICKGKKAIVFASNIASSKEVCAALQVAGHNARHVDGDMGKQDRADVLAWFKHTPDAILCNCDLMTTGFDEPTIEVVILYRATASLPLFMQMVGRGSRVTPTKKEFTILDFGNNVQTHGFWHDRQNWSLKKKRKKKSAGVGGAKNCKGCDALIPVGAMVCPHCKYEYQRKPKEQGEIVDLHLMSKAEAMQVAKTSTMWQKAQLAKAKVISPYWVLHNHCKTKAEALEFIAFMGWKPGWAYHNKNRFKILQS